MASSGDLAAVRARGRPRAAGRRRPSGVAVGPGDGRLWLAPAAGAALYAVTLLVNLHAVIAAVYRNSDAAVDGVLGEAIGHFPAGSYVSLGNRGWFEEWLFLEATRGLPGHRSLWEVGPLLWSLMGLVLLIWTARRLLGWGPAALCGAALLCVGPFGRFCSVAIAWHSLSLTHTIVLAAVAVGVLPQLRRVPTAGLAAGAVLVGALCAFPTASDSLFIFWALIPLAVTAAVLAARSRSLPRGRLFAFTTIVVLVAAVGAWGVTSILHGEHVVARALPLELVAPSMIADNLALLVESFVYLAGGSLEAPSSSLHDVLSVVSAVLALLALLAVLDHVRRLAGRSARAGLPDRLLAYVVFWVTSMLAASVVFVLSDAPKDALSGRYLLSAYAATAALLPLVALRSRRARALVLAGVCVFALIATYQLASQPSLVIGRPGVAARFPGPKTTGALESFARQEHVTQGYGGYWDAEELTWATNFKVLVRPVRPCSGRRPALCYPQLGSVSSWYRPRPHTRSLLIVDAPGSSFNVVLAPDPRLGRPLASRRLGLIDVYVYPYDIASKLKAPRCGFTWAHPC
jgi:hypothetical protein